MARCISYSVVGSTQEVALRLATEGAPHGTAVSAESQMLGRGREGRAWASPKGGLYLSMVLRPKPEALPLLSLSCGLELRALLEPHAPRARLLIKWPNDLLVLPHAGGPARKLGGVIIEVVSRPGSPPFAVAGVGLNVEEHRADFPPELQEQVAFLSEVSERAVAPHGLIKPVRGAILAACSRAEDPSARAALPAALTPHLYGIGRPVTVGGQRGTFRGVGTEGQALVELPGEGAPRSFVAGDLQLEVA